MFPGSEESEIEDPAQVLNDPSWMAARALGEVAPGTPWAETALAALTEALRTDTDERRLKIITRTLGRFGPAATRAVPDLTKALRKTVAARGASDLWLWTIADSLVRIAPGTRAADEAVTVVTECLKSREDQERQVMAIQSLIRMGPRAHTAVPELINLMKSDQMRTEGWVGRRWVPEALGKIAPGTESAERAITALAEALDVDEADIRLGALHALSRFGPAAKSAIPQIQVLKKVIAFEHLADQVLRAISPRN
jgi:hypothetical protein